MILYFSFLPFVHLTFTNTWLPALIDLGLPPSTPRPSSMYSFPTWVHSDPLMSSWSLLPPSIPSTLSVLHSPRSPMFSSEADSTERVQNKVWRRTNQDDIRDKDVVLLMGMQYIEEGTRWRGGGRYSPASRDPGSLLTCGRNRTGVDNCTSWTSPILQLLY